MTPTRSPVARILITLVGMDALISTLIAATFFAMMEIEGDAVGTAVGVYAGLWGVKVCVYTSIIASRLRPLSQWFASDQPPTDPDLIAEVATTAYRAPFTISTAYATLYAGAYMANTLVLYGGFADAVPLGPASLSASALASVALLLGSMNVIFPFAEWLMAPMVEHVSLTAHERGVDARGPGLAYRSRLVGFALTLALAPCLFLSSITYMKDAHAAERELGLRAQLALDAAGGAPDALPDALPFAFDADGNIGDPSAAQAVAERPGLRRMFERAAASGASGTVIHPREGVIAFHTAAGRRVGVMIPQVGTVSFGTKLLLILFLLIVLSWAPGCATFLAGSTAVPVVRISNALAKVGEGDVAAAPKVPVFHQDEVGALARNYNTMLDQLRQLAQRTHDVSKGALDVQFDLRGDLGDAFRNQVASLRDIVGHIAQNAAQLASAATEMYAATQEQETAAQAQTVGVEEVQRTMESLLVAATHVTESTMNVLTRAERTRETTIRMSDRIGELTAHASRIGEILEVIREIANRSDLLALNASLEGTRAGEAGRGFALVAGEMRKLAERVTASVGDIKKLVSDVRASVSATVIANEESSSLATGSFDSARQISLVTQQQRSGTEQVGQSMRDVAAMINQSLAATQQIRSLAGDLKSQADNLNGLVARFRLPGRRPGDGA